MVRQISLQAVNTTGLLGLPVELFDMVLGCFDFDMFTEEDIRYYDWVAFKALVLVNREYRSRFHVLRALSQTCRALRISLLPLVWEHVEVCTSKPGNALYQGLARRLWSNSKLLASTPHIAKHVKVFSVFLTRASEETTLPAFAACLNCLPNLHTLQIVSATKYMATAIKTALEGVSFPQIRTVVLPLEATAVLRSCPNVTRIALHHYAGYGDPLRIICEACPKVEILQGLPLTAKVVKALLKAAPAVRKLGFEVDHSNEIRSDPQHDLDLSLLSKLKNLSVIRIDDFDMKNPTKKKTLLDGLGNALSKIKTKEEKRIIVSYSIQPYRSENTIERERTEVIIVE